jgi:hypothetical protein
MTNSHFGIDQFTFNLVETCQHFSNFPGDHEDPVALAPAVLAGSAGVLVSSRPLEDPGDERAARAGQDGQAAELDKPAVYVAKLVLRQAPLPLPLLRQKGQGAASLWLRRQGPLQVLAVHAPGGILQAVTRVAALQHSARNEEDNYLKDCASAVTTYVEETQSADGKLP